MRNWNSSQGAVSRRWGLNRACAVSIGTRQGSVVARSVLRLAGLAVRHAGSGKCGSGLPVCDASSPWQVAGCARSDGAAPEPVGTRQRPVVAAAGLRRASAAEGDRAGGISRPRLSVADGSAPWQRARCRRLDRAGPGRVAARQGAVVADTILGGAGATEWSGSCDVSGGGRAVCSRCAPRQGAVCCWQNPAASLAVG